MNALNNIITARLDSKPRIKRIAAIVTEIVANTDNGKVKVRFMNSKNEESVLTLLNKSRDELAVGDSVWVHYWNTVSDGYVAIKTGLSSFDSESPTYPLPLPLHTNSLVTDTYCFNKRTGTSSSSYSFSLSTTQEASQISYPTIGQVEEIVYVYDDGTYYLYQTPLTMLGGQGITSLSDYPRVPLSIEVYDDLTLPTLRNGEITNVRYSIETDSQNYSMLVRYIGGVREVVVTLQTQRMCKFGLLNYNLLTYDPNLFVVVGNFTVAVCTYYNGGWEIFYNSTSYPQEFIVLGCNAISVQTTKTTITKQTLSG